MAEAFFDDPALDRLVGVTVALAAEVQVLRDRQRALEGVLRDKGVVTLADIEAWQPPDAAERAAVENEADRFVRAVLGPLAAGEP